MCEFGFGWWCAVALQQKDCLKVVLWSVAGGQCECADAALGKAATATQRAQDTFVDDHRLCNPRLPATSKWPQNGPVGWLALAGSRLPKMHGQSPEIPSFCVCPAWTSSSILDFVGFGYWEFAFRAPIHGRAMMGDCQKLKRLMDGFCWITSWVECIQILGQTEHRIMYTPKLSK